MIHNNTVGLHAAECIEPLPLLEVQARVSRDALRFFSSPNRPARPVEENLDRVTRMTANTSRAPRTGIGQRDGERVLGEPSDGGTLERVCLQRTAHRSEVEDERVEGHLGETEPKTVQDHDQAHWLDVDPRLFEDFLHGDLGSRVAHVGPTGRVEPGSRVRPLHEQD